MKESRGTRELMQAVFQEYAGGHTPASLKYLHGRGLTDETIETELIGFCNGSVKLPDASEDDLLATGLFNADLSHHYQGRVVFPYLKYGAPVFSIGRALGDDKRKYIKHLTYDENSRDYVSQDAIEHIIWGEDCIQDKASIVCVEGIIDAILLRQTFPDIPIISPVTTQWSKAQIERLQGKIQLAKRITFIPDNEVGDAGLRGVTATAGKIWDGVKDADNPPEVHIARLRRSEGRTKVDVADYIANGLERELEIWIKASVPFYYEKLRQEDNTDRFRNNKAAGYRYSPVYPENEIRLMPSYFATVGGVLRQYKDGYYQPADHMINRDIKRLLGHEWNSNRHKEIIAALRSDTQVEANETNPNPYEVNVLNGVYNLQTGEFGPHSPRRYDTRQCPVIYERKPDDNDAATLVEKFLEEIFPQLDRRMAAIELAGYCLLGHQPKLQKAFMLEGVGANGKSTFMKWITAMLGKENVSSQSLHDLGNKDFSASQLYGKLANMYDDLDAKALRNTGVFKSLTTGDSIDAQYKYQDPFSFENEATLVFSCNELPKSFDHSYGYYRRWSVITFSEQFDGEEADRDILDKLTTPACLTYLFRHATLAIRTAIERGELIKTTDQDATIDEMRRNDDSTYAFVQDHTTLAADDEITSQEIYAAYLTYCDSLRLKRPESRTKLYKQLRSTYDIEPRASNSQSLWKIELMNIEEAVDLT